MMVRTWARWGLLLTTLAMGATLVGTAVLGYQAAWESSDAVIEMRGRDLLASNLRSLFWSQDPEAAAQTVLEESSELGLVYLGIVNLDDGERLLEAGSAIGPLAPDDLPAMEEGQPSIRRLGEGERIQAVQTLGLGRRPRGRGWWGRDRDRERDRRSQDSERGDPPGAESPEQPAPETPEGEAGDENDPEAAPEEGERERRRPSSRERGRRPSMPRLAMVVEFEPLIADDMTDRALVALILSLVAAGLLIGAAGVFWRLARKADTFTEQLARDQHLKKLGEVSAVLGHELRNPLTSLKGHAQLLKEATAGEEQLRPSVDTVLKEVLRLEQLIDHVLDYARTGTLEMAAGDPRLLALAAVEATDPERIQLEVEGAPEVWPFDPARMEQVLVNLLKNALEAAPDQPVLLRVEAHGAALRLVVADQGPGIPPGDEEQIFEPFYTTRTRGTGLGLALVRRIVIGHGGTIQAANRPGGGAAFTITLPPGGC